MPRRSILTARQRAALFDLPTDEATILYHYTLADDDLEFIRTRRHARNRLGSLFSFVLSDILADCWRRVRSFQRPSAASSQRSLAKRWMSFADTPRPT